MTSPTLKNFLHAVLVQRKVLLLMGLAVIFGITLDSWIYTVLVPIAAGLGAIYRQKILYRLEVENDTLVLYLMNVSFPFRLEEIQIRFSLDELYKVEYLPEEDNGQVHILLKNSRKPSRDFAVVPSPYWTERSQAILAERQPRV